jgi:integrase
MEAAMRASTGSIIEHVGKDQKTYRSLRFMAAGKRQFVALGAVSQAVAERELRHLLADLERGTWTPPTVPEPAVEPEPCPSFHEHAEGWWSRNEGRWSDATRGDYRWRLERHALPALGDKQLDEITAADIDRMTARMREDGLSARSCNMVVTIVGAVLDDAQEQDLVGRNVARGRGRRIRERRPARTVIDSAPALAALLDAAGALDREATRHSVERRALLVVFACGGLRIGEALGLRWRHVDLAAGRLRVEAGKTAAAVRTIRMRGLLRDELAALRARRPGAAPDDLVFGTSTGRRQSPSNVRNRILRPVCERANVILAEQGRPPLPALTPHSLRRTCATIEAALGRDPRSLMAMLGHTSAAFSLSVYAQTMDVDDREREQLRALVDGGDQLAVRGSWAAETAEEAGTATAA